VRIAYTETFKEVYGYLRAVLKTNEISDRAFQLTKDAALLNPANYTVWYYRRILLRALNKSLKDELNFITEVIQDNPKNYQVWQHRRCIIDFLKDPSEELAFIMGILNHDSKNYHAWQYRQYIIKCYDLWEGELEYVENLINRDIRNNSAWNQRYFCINNTQDTSNVEIINQELNYCKEKLLKCIDNESVWNYLKAFLRNLEVYPIDFVDFCFDLFKNTKDDEKSPFLCSFICDSYEIKILEWVKLIDSNEIKDVEKINELKLNIKVNFNNSLEILEQLKSKYDLMREKYWLYVIRRWEKKYSSFIN
jgi:protein farnesyltransferase/geranylgeranyltransferase type-1 subunit alpha